jgi:hypothetical protein
MISTMKNNFFSKGYWVMTILVVLSACKDFSELEKNPNAATSSPPNLILNGALAEMYKYDAFGYTPWSDAQKWNQFYISNYYYYGDNRYSWVTGDFAKRYGSLKNIGKMEESAKSAGAPTVNPYAAIGKFLKAYYFTQLTQQMGNIPFTEALDLTKLRPAYDDQKTVYAGILQLLEDANTDLSALIAKGDISLNGDFYFNNNLASWQKVVNSFKLRVMISLSKRVDDGAAADLGIPQKFTDVITNKAKYPVFESNADNLKYVYNGQFNLYPRNPGSIGSTNFRENISATYLGIVTSLKDPRTYTAATPAPYQIGNVSPTGTLYNPGLGKALNDFTAYVGGDQSKDMSVLLADAGTGTYQYGTQNIGNGLYSYENAIRYYGSNDGSTCEPFIIIGYPELCFNIAEGFHKGWVSGKTATDVETYYVNGIKASMDMVKIVDGGSIPIGDLNGHQLGTVIADVSGYLTGVKYKGINTDGYNQILTQKYIAFFQNSGLEAFYNQRRTGIPTFIAGGTGTGNGGLIPRRWQYPYNEITANTENYKTATQDQFGGSDNINTDIWITKKN